MGLAVFKHRQLQLALLIVVLAVLVGVRSPVFLSASSLDSLLTDSAILVMLALAQMLVILTRGIDLSVASNLALSGMAVALISRHWPALPIGALIPMAMAIGLGLGAINGALIGYLRLPPIV